MRNLNATTGGIDPSAIDPEKYPHYRQFRELELSNGMEAVIYRGAQSIHIAAEKAAFWAENSQEPAAQADGIGDALRAQFAERKAWAEQTRNQNQPEDEPPEAA